MIGRRKKQETERMAEPAEAQKLPFGYEAYTWLHDVVSCLAFVMILFVFFLRLIGVSGPSMTPTLLNGDRVILLKDGNIYRQLEKNIQTRSAFHDTLLNAIKEMSGDAK